MSRREQILDWESRWLVPTGIATLVAVALLLAASFVIGGVSGDGEAELLRSAAERSSDITLSSILQAAGFLLLAAPLYVLFRAAAARSQQMRYQLIGVVIAAPLFFAISSVLNATATNEAADQFVAGNAESTLSVRDAASDCREQRRDEGAEDFAEEFDAGESPQQDCVATAIADEEAENAISDASTRGLATGFGFGGRIGLAVALVYTCLHAMRVGLLSRFWGSLGMALGVAALLLLVQFTLIFFIYLGLLLIGKIPNGRPPAWETGEAIPWPSPGEQAAGELQGDGEGEAADTDADDQPRSAPSGDEPPRRKRKQRD